MKRLRIIIETDLSSWTPEQIERYQSILKQLLRNDTRPIGDKQTWIFEDEDCQNAEKP